MKKTYLYVLFIVYFSFLGTKVSAQNPNWSINPSNYQFSATYTTFLTVSGTNLNKTNDQVAAFVNGEIRGVGNLVYVASSDKFVAFLTVYANTSGETINFKIYDSSASTVYTAIQTDIFVIDATKGSVFQSYAISNTTLDDRSVLADVNFQGITAVTKTTSSSKNNNIVDTFSFVLPPTTDLSTLVADLSIPFNAKAFVLGQRQVSGVNTLDFTDTVVYQILSEDESNRKDYFINVALAQNNTTTGVSISSNSTTKDYLKEIEVEFSNPIIGLERDDFELKNAVISKFIEVDAKNFIIEISAITEGTFSIFLKPESVVDADNITNTVSNTLEFISDTTPPMLTLAELKFEGNDTYFELTFNEEVYNVDLSDFQLTGMLKNKYLITTGQLGYFSTPISQRTATTYRINVIRVDNDESEGSLFLKVKSDSDIEDLMGNSILPQETFAFFLDKQTLSTKTYALDSLFSIYPNPVKDLIFITYPNEVYVKSIVLYNVSGKKIFKTKTALKKFSVANLSNGLYFVKMMTDKGVVLKKFIKNN